MWKTANFPAAKLLKCAKNNCQYVHSFLPTNILLHTRIVYTKKTQQTEWNRGQNQVKKVHENVWNEQKRDFPFTYLYCIIIYFTIRHFHVIMVINSTCVLGNFIVTNGTYYLLSNLTHSIPVLILKCETRIARAFIPFDLENVDS